MFKKISQILEAFESSLLIKKPLRWIFKIHWIIPAIIINVIITLIYGIFMPLWTNAWLFVILFTIINCLFAVYWNKRVDAYLPSLYSLKSKLIIYSAKIICLFFLFAIPFFIPFLLHKRSTNAFHDSALFSDAIPLAVNHKLVINYYGDFASLEKIYDTIISIEEKDADTSNSIFTYQYVIEKDISRFTFREEVMMEYLNYYFQQYISDKISTDKIIADNLQFGENINQYRSTENFIFYLDTLPDHFKFLRALRDASLYKWITNTTPWKLLEELSNARTDIDSNLQQLNSKVEGRTSSRLDLPVGHDKYNYNYYLPFGRHNTCINSLSKEEFEKYYANMCQLVVNSVDINSKEDIQKLGAREKGVTYNLRMSNSIHFLTVFSIILIIVVLFCNIMLIKQVNSARTSSRFVILLVVSLIIEYLLSILGIDRFENEDNFISLLSYYFPILMSLFYFIVMLIIISRSNTSIVKFQDKLMPFVFGFWPVSLIGFLVFYAYLDDKYHWKMEFPEEKIVAFFVLIGVIFLFMTFIIAKKFISFYSSPQAK